MPKALGLLSGGLDSTLSAHCLLRQGIAVTGIAFVTPFFSSARAEKAAASLGIPLIVRPIAELHLEIVKNPLYGYGRNCNPCIDCHALMFREAGVVLAEQGFDFLFSGEVLGQRPMSQNLSALQAVASHSGQATRILRPLSAQLLPETAMEASGLVDRSRLLSISGRSRRPQQALAAEWGILEYPGSGGGCLLTEKSFTPRLRDLLEHDRDCTPRDIEILKFGRPFRLSPTAKLTLGREQAHNERLRALANAEETILFSEQVTGPLGLLSAGATAAEQTQAAAIVAAYGKGSGLAAVVVTLLCGGHRSLITVTPLTRLEAEQLRID